MRVLNQTQALAGSTKPLRHIVNGHMLLRTWHFNRQKKNTTCTRERNIHVQESPTQIQTPVAPYVNARTHTQTLRKGSRGRSAGSNRYVERSFIPQLLVKPSPRTSSGMFGMSSGSTHTKKRERGSAIDWNQHITCDQKRASPSPKNRQQSQTVDACVAHHRARSSE